VPLPATVATTPGEWKIRARQPTPGTNRYTRDSHVGTFTVLAEVLTSCIPTADPSGLITSPRAGGGSGATNLANNIILGIDHDLFPVAHPLPNRECDADAAPYPDARLDVTSPTDGATCVDVWTFPGASAVDGLINGSGALNGRLVGTPTVSTSGNCQVSGDDDLQWPKNSQVLVDTALSCYLKPGRSLSDVKNGRSGSLSAAILSDPRFFAMPRTDTTFHPSNVSGSTSDAQYWPIKDLVGAFLTNETEAGGNATCASNSDCNGLVFGSGGQLDSIQAFTFRLSALSAAADPGNGRAYIGGPKDLLLVE
jgi:hypothetical protein